MKKIIYKICTLCLIMLFITTGCGKNNNSVNKIKKQDDLSNNERVKQENILHYYDLKYIKFKDKETLLKQSEKTKKLYKNSFKDTKITKDEENEFEVYYSTIKEPSSNEFNKLYLLHIIKDDELIRLVSYALDEDMSYMEDIASELKKYTNKYNTLKEAYEAYSKDNNLSKDKVTADDIDLDIIKEYSKASNQYTVVQYGEEGKVETVSLENIELTNSTVKTLAVARTKDKKRVWSLDLGISDKSINYKDSIFVEVGDKYVYFGYDLMLYARDIQTGELVMTPTTQMGSGFLKVVETKDYLYAFAEGDNKEYSGVILGYDGKVNYYFSINKRVEYNGKLYQIKDITSAKLENENIVIDVYDNTKVVGKYYYNTKTLTKTFKKI